MAAWQIREVITDVADRTSDSNHRPVHAFITITIVEHGWVGSWQIWEDIIDDAATNVNARPEDAIITISVVSRGW